MDRRARFDQPARPPRLTPDLEPGRPIELHLCDAKTARAFGLVQHWPTHIDRPDPDECECPL